MNTMKSIMVVLLTSVILWFAFFHEDSVTLGPGVKAKEPPVQKAVDKKEPFIFKGYTFIPKATIDLTAKVLGRENYRFDKNSDLSPMDLALGWGRMSDEKILERIDITQKERWYHWYTDNFPIPREEIETCSANMHMIPSTDSVSNYLKDVRKGDIVKIGGILVDIRGENNFRWNSSMTRKDVGDGACEVIYVTYVAIVETR